MSLCIWWDQIPHGVASDHTAISDDVINSRRAAGSIPIAGTTVNGQYIARNNRWVNYLYYNVIDWTIEVLDGVSDQLQLYATSLMTLQNRLIRETVSRGAGSL